MRADPLLLHQALVKNRCRSVRKVGIEGFMPETPNDPEAAPSPPSAAAPLCPIDRVLSFRVSSGTNDARRSG